MLQTKDSQLKREAANERNHPKKHFRTYPARLTIREALLTGRRRTFNLFVLTRSDQVFLYLKILFTFFTKQATLRGGQLY